MYYRIHTIPSRRKKKIRCEETSYSVFTVDTKLHRRLLLSVNNNKYSPHRIIVNAMQCNCIERMHFVAGKIAIVRINFVVVGSLHLLHFHIGRFRHRASCKRFILSTTRLVYMSVWALVHILSWHKPRNRNYYNLLLLHFYNILAV